MEDSPCDKKYNPFNLDLRKSFRGTGNYTGTEFDIDIHDTDAGEFIITHVSNLMKDGKMKQR